MPLPLSFRPSLTFRGRKFKGLRGWAGKPLHPPLTDIPVGAYMLAPAFDVISFIGQDERWARELYRAGTFTLVGGFVVGVFAALTGFWDWLKSTQKGTQARRTVNAHAWTMVTVTVLVIIDIAMRWFVYDERINHTPGRVMVVSLAVAALTALGGTIGGGLAYDYGFNVETSGDHPVWHESEDDVFPGDHPNGRRRRAYDPVVVGGEDGMDDLVALYRRAVEGFGERVAAVKDDQWEQPTPCADWSVRQLVNHVVGENAWAVPLFAGRTIADVGDELDGDLLGADPVAAWRDAAGPALAAAEAEGALERTVHVSFGDIPGREYLSQITTDHVIHAWDLARGAGGDEALDPDLVAFAYEYLEPQVEGWRAAGAFGPSVDVAEDASLQDRLLGLSGRRP